METTTTSGWSGGMTILYGVTMPCEQPPNGWYEYIPYISYPMPDGVSVNIKLSTGKEISLTPPEAKELREKLSELA